MPDLVALSLAQRAQLQPRPRAVAAAARHGVISARQLHALGMKPAAVRRWAASGRLHRIHRGVYAVGHPSLTGHGRWLGAVLACGPAALLSHASAAALWELRPTSRRLVDVTTPSGHRRPGLAVHRARHLTPADRTELHGIPVTSVARTLLDLAGTAPARAVERAWEEADRLQRLDLNAVRATAARAAGHHGLPTLLSLVARAHENAPTRSELERAFLDLCRSYGLPTPEINVVVEGLEVDARFRAEELVVELDGYAFHHTRRSFEVDRTRDITLQLAGLRVIRLTHRRITEAPRDVAADLAALLAC